MSFTPEELREWTVMFYLATDNPLAPGVITHLKQMKSAGYHPQVNVLAQFDPHNANLQVHIFDVNRLEKLKCPDTVNIGFAANDSYVRNLVGDKLWDDDANKSITDAVKKKDIDYHAPIPTGKMFRDNDPKESLRLFLEFCRTRYPARHYMLFLLGHGEIVGGDIFLYDEHGRTRKNGVSGPKSLLLKDLGELLTDFKKEIKEDKGELELIGFHACSMSGAEVAYELRNTANYMLAAQGPTYIGSWPYRQILIRLFNDLGRSPFPKDVVEGNGLLGRLKTGGDKTSRHMRALFNGNGVGTLLDEYIPGEKPPPTLITKTVKEFGRVLGDSDLYLDWQQKEQAPEITNLIERHDDKENRLNGEYLHWLNGKLLLQGLPKRECKTYTEANIRKLLLSIFKYCLFNSLDFQLAGYSADLTLCDLRKVGDIREPVKDLVTALTSSLTDVSRAKKQVIRNLLVLAHWESQSFYTENYTDLYDFCFCLKRQCEHPPAGMSRHFNQIKKACDDVMGKLRRGSEKYDDGVIVRCETCGPAYQYAHGLSVYFPWSEPLENNAWTDEYGDFSFSRATGWRKFLELYFEETMRAPQEAEGDPLDRCPFPAGLGRDQKLADLLENISTARVFNDDGQLKIGSKDPLGFPPVKVGSIDPQGGDCDCGSIKNFPPIVHDRRNQKRFRFKGHRLVSHMYESYKNSLEKHCKRKR